jgi:hypothetical protein
MPEPEYEALLRRRRIWGVPPDAVEQIAADCERTQAELRTRMRELEVRLAQVTTQRDEATQSVATLRAQVAQLERENAEAVGRPEMVREEALRFVVDAWAEAQTIREQTRLENEKAEIAAREEIAAARQALAEERGRHEAEMREARARHEAEIAALRERRSKAVADLESLAEHLLNQATHIAALKSPVAEPAASPTAEAPPEKTAAPPLSTSEPIAVAPAPSTATIPAVAAPPRANGNDAEDHLLAKALNDLEAILGASRKTNGTG